MTLVTDLQLPPVAPVTEAHAPLDWRPSWGPAPRWATPRSLHRPTYGGVVGRLSASIGLPLMPWQAYIHDVANEVDPDTGWWAYDEVIVTVPRQAGKTTLKIPLYRHRLQLVPGGELWMTAQNGEKAVKRWTKATDAMLRLPNADRELKRWIGRSAWKLQDLATGALLVPFAPNDENMHGESPDLVDVDEWWAFDALAAEGLQAAYRPGLLTRNAQVWKTSTMGTEESAGLNADVKKGRAAVEMDRRTGTAYFEWSLEDEPGGIPIDELTDDQLVEACLAIHPAVGFHPTAPAEKMRYQIRQDLKRAGNDEGTLSRREYIRAYGNRLQSASGGWKVIPQPMWVRQFSPRPIPVTAPVGMGFEVDPDGRDAAVAVAWRDSDGRARIEITKVADGSAWVAGTVAGLEKRWTVLQTAVQNSGPARHVADKVIADGVDVLRMSQMDFSAASQQFYAEVKAGTLWHLGQPPLNAAVEHVDKRRSGPTGSWSWKVDPAVSITALVAATAALWAVDHPRDTEPDIGPFRVY